MDMVPDKEDDIETLISGCMYSPNDPLVRKAISIGDLIWMPLFLISILLAFSSLVVFDARHQINTFFLCLPCIMLGATMLDIILTRLWFDWWINRVHDPDQLYHKILIQRRVVRGLYNTYKKRHPTPRYYQPLVKDGPYPLIEIRFSRIKYSLLILFFGLDAIGFTLVCTWMPVDMIMNKKVHIGDVIPGLIVFMMIGGVGWYMVIFFLRNFLSRKIQIQLNPDGFHITGEAYSWNKYAGSRVDSTGKAKRLIIMCAEGKSKAFDKLHLLEIRLHKVVLLMDAYKAAYDRRNNIHSLWNRPEK